MTSKKKIKEDASEVVAAGANEEVERTNPVVALAAEEPVLIAGAVSHEVLSAVPVGEIPVADLRELLELLRVSYSRSNVRDFRLKAKRLEKSVGDFVSQVELSLKTGL